MRRFAAYAPCMTETSTTTTPSETPKRRGWVERHPFLAVLAGLLVLSAWLGFRSSGAPATGDEFTAASMCERFVADHLKSPSTAEFDSTATGGGDTWTVTGTVDSQNSFGAMVRNTYTCHLTYEGGDSWRLDSLSGLAN